MGEESVGQMHRIYIYAYTRGGGGEPINSWNSDVACVLDVVLGFAARY